jgi:hypothetical protein
MTQLLQLSIYCDANIARYIYSLQSGEWNMIKLLGKSRSREK